MVDSGRVGTSVRKVFEAGKNYHSVYLDHHIHVRLRYGNSATVEAVRSEEGEDAADQYVIHTKALDLARTTLLRACDNYFQLVPERPPIDDPDHAVHRATSRIAGLARVRRDIETDLEDLRRLAMVSSRKARSELSMTIEELCEVIKTKGKDPPHRTTVIGWIKNSKKQVLELIDPSIRPKQYRRAFLYALAQERGYL